MKILVIGATGQLGQDLMRVFGDEAVGLSHEDVDVRDDLRVVEKIASLHPEWVINTAAFHKVDDCEDDPVQAFSVNAVGALNVARASARVGAGVVFFSTDYVYGGEPRQSGHAYTEDVSPSPVNVYGVSKVAGERLVCLANTRHIIARTTGLYGIVKSHKGWTFPELMIQKAKSDAVVRVVKDQIISPTYTLDLARKVKELVECSAQGLFHLTNSGECSWHEFTQVIFELSGIKREIMPITTKELGRRATRPGYSALASVRLKEFNIKPMRPWQEALASYLKAKGLLA